MFSTIARISNDDLYPVRMKSRNRANCVQAHIDAFPDVLDHSDARPAVQLLTEAYAGSGEKYTSYTVSLNAKYSDLSGPECTRNMR
jgi:hypothetical protein